MNAPPDQHAALTELARGEYSRRNFTAFCQLMDPTFERAPHLDLLASHLEALERRDIRKLLVAMPPRSGKSRSCAQDFVGWYLGRNPRHEIVIASYGAQPAERHSRKVREIVGSEHYPFATRVDPSSSAVDMWQTTAGGVVRAVGVEGALTSLGANLAVWDDIVKDAASANSAANRETNWEWYQSVGRTRLMPGAVQCAIGTRWHEDDFMGRLLNSSGANEWTTLILPAIAEPGDPLGREVGEALWPKWYPLQDLPSVEKGEISSRMFSALYQQRPVPAEGGLFKVDWFKSYRELPKPKSATFTMFGGVDLISAETNRRFFTITAIDCASKTGVSNDFSAIVTMLSDGMNAYVVDVIRERLEFSDLARTIVDVCRKHKPAVVYIEDASAGIPIVQELRRLTSLPIVAVPAKGSKIARAEAVTPRFESGRVLVPERAPWLKEFIDEFASFPAGRHDDMVDATVLGVTMLERSLERQRLTSRNADVLKNYMER